MTELPYNRLVEVAHDRAQDDLRGVARYTTTGVEVLYHREDLDEDLTRERLEEAAEAARGQTPLVEDGIGKRRAGFALHEDAFLVYLHIESAVVVISLEPAQADGLVDFVADCRLALTEPDTTTEPTRELD